MTNEKSNSGWGKPEGWVNEAAPVSKEAWVNLDLNAWPIIDNAQKENKFSAAQKNDWPLKVDEPKIVVDGVETITIIIPRENDWPLELKLIPVGDLGCYDPITMFGETSRVIHLPTLSRFDKAVPHDLPTSKLVEWCKKVQEDLPEDWKILRRLTQDNYKTDNKFILEVKERLLQHCLTTRI